MRRFSLNGCLILGMLVMLSGCPAAPSAKEEYDAALKELNAEQSRLDALLPGFTAAKLTAMQSVTRERAGTTTEEALSGTLSQLDSMTKALQEKQADPNAKPGDMNAQIDQIVSSQTATLDQIGAMTSSAGKAGEVMKNIQTPGTPEAKRFEEVFNAMPEVQAYKRQEERLAKAKQAVLEAEAKLPAAK